jgi:hypothetical protein
MTARLSHHLTSLLLWMLIPHDGVCGTRQFRLSLCLAKSETRCAGRHSPVVGAQQFVLIRILYLSSHHFRLDRVSSVNTRRVTLTEKLISLILKLGNTVYIEL